ncbi:protein takeout [Condylostylus longicornis]|uniref:protein takeout n=1 Tax=Condylostylus longicornis TaxID=2530218 RepID=UPI00244DD581|nr:protein takeout [Condylostylus longicornis]
MIEIVNKWFFIQILFCLMVFGADDLPPTFDKCKRDTNFDKCLVDAVNKALVLLKDGSAEFGVAPLEPLKIKSMSISSGNAPINLKQNFKNVKVNDLISTSTITRYRTKLDKHLIVCDSISKKIEVIADYEISGRILLLPITGHGQANITLIDTKIEHHLIGEPYTKDGVLYNKLKEYKVIFNPKRVYMYFDNLFGDCRLSEAMNRFLNDNWELVFNELKSGYSESFGKVFKEITNKIFTKVPMDTLFPR